MILAELEAYQSRPIAPTRRLALGELNLPCDPAPGFGGILDQDTENLLLQQEGLEAASKKTLTLGNYQEIRIRHCERSLDRYMAMPPLDVDWRTQQKCGRH